MAKNEIKNLRKFLEKCLNTTVLDYKLNDLTKSGDNYGSVLQSLQVTVADNDGCRKELQLVAKSAVTNPYLVEVFQPSVTFVKETQFYSKIIPAIERFEEDSNITRSDRLDAFIKCIGSRISLDSEATSADIDAVLILENTKHLNYANEDRRNGFDSQTTFHILSSLAQFHALCIAMRRQQPDVFDEHIVPYIEAINLFQNDEERLLVKTVCKEVQLVEGIDAEYRSKILAQLLECDTFNRNTIRVDDSPYTTIVHRDLWINNIMILRDANGKASKIKIYDFQLYFYHSFVSDLIFFLMTSVRYDDLMRNFRIFINHYHEHFVKVLKRANCPLNDYTIDKTWAEIRAKAKNELLHSIFMTKLVHADHADIPPLDEMTPETFSSDKPLSEMVLKRWKLILDLYRENHFL